MTFKTSDRFKILSNLLLVLFSILVIATSYFSHVFQNKFKTQMTDKIGSRIFSENEFFYIDKITIKNKSGEFSFEKNKETANSWHMISPKDVSANSVFIKEFFSSLVNLKIKKILNEDKNNYTNYSFDRPSSSVNMIDSSGKSIELLFGIVNSIDSSTYLKISNRKGYLHVDLPTPSIEDANLFDFIETQIIPIRIAQIKSVKIYKKEKSPNNILLSYSKVNNQWVGILNKPVVTDKVFNYLQELSLLKSNFIIEKPTEAQKKAFTSILKKIDYILSIENINNTFNDYIITSNISNIPDIDLKNEEHFIFYNNSGSYYILRKDIKNSLVNNQL